MDTPAEEESAKEEGELSDDGEIIGEPKGNQVSNPNDDKSNSSLPTRHHGHGAQYSHQLAEEPRQHKGTRYEGRKYERSPERRRYTEARRERNENDRQSGASDAGRSGFWAKRRTPYHVRYGSRRPLAAVPVPSLLSMPIPGGPHYLNVQPPPPPPPPPPPLPTDPPPTAPEPPPLFTPRYNVGVKIKPRYSAKEVSSPSPDDSEYIDLLLEYTQIKKQLETIKKEEAKAVNSLSGAGYKSKVDIKDQKAENAGPNALIDLTKDDDQFPASSQLKPTVAETVSVAVGSEKSIDEPAPKDRTNYVPNPPVASTSEDTKLSNVAQEEEEDEDMDILELKLAALASTVKAENRKGSKSVEKTPGTRSSTSTAKSRNRKDIGRRNSQNRLSTKRRKQDDHRQAEIKRRQQERQKREERRLSEERRRVELTRRREEERQRRERKDERDRDKERRDLELKKKEDRQERERFEEKRLAAQKLLTLNDPEEQYKRFMELFSDGRDHEMLSRRVPKNKKQRTTSTDTRSKEIPSTRDNYDEVEMELDSDDGSGAAIEVVPQQPQVLIPGLDIVNRLQAIASMPVPPPPPPDYLMPLSMNFGNNWGAQIDSKSSEQTIPGLDLVYENDDPMDLEETEQTEIPPFHNSSLAPMMNTGIDEAHMLSDVMPAEEAQTAQSSPASIAHIPEQEEDEEGKLRAKLLKSLMKRKQEQLENENKSAASPSPDRELEYHPTKIIELVNRQKSNVPARPPPPSIRMMAYPRHARVVVTLGPDSDESDEETPPRRPTGAPFSLPGSIDQFLKEARQTVEAKRNNSERKVLIVNARTGVPKTAVSPKTSNHAKSKPTVSEKSNKEKKAELQQILKAKVIQLESALAKERNEVTTEMKSKELIREQIYRKKNNLRQSEIKVQKLREQLAASDRVVKANQTQLHKYTIKAQSVQSRVDEKHRRISAIEKQLVVAGQRAYGDKYSRTIRPNEGGDMRITVANAKGQSLDPKFIAEEKARLQDLEKRLLQMIRSVKEGKGSDHLARPALIPDANVELEYDLPEVEHIKTEETMSFSFGPEVEKEVTTIEPKRRRSLVDIHASTKPNLPVKLNDNQTKGNNEPATASKEKLSESNIKEKDKKVILPTGQRLQNLAKLSAENMEKLCRAVDNTSDDGLPFQHKPCTSLLNAKQGNIKKVRRIKPKRLESYRSPLKCFKSFRFNPYFRNKEGYNLNSTSFSHKLNPSKVLCRFDLNGKCNDATCRWQHRSDYELADEEILSDLVSYEPNLTQVTENSAGGAIKDGVGKFVSKFRKQNDKMSHDDRCILLTSLVNKSAKHVPPHTIFQATRAWKLEPAERKGANEVIMETKDERKQQVSVPTIQTNRLEEDNIISEGDVRYWMLASEEMEDMESAVLENPSDIDMWIKLAYKKLADQKRFGQENIDHALNVLARALESNKTSNKLWHHYLALYSNRLDPEDLILLCKQSVQYAPSYDLYWMYLQIVRKCSLKNKLCKKILLFLCSNNCKAVPADERSHNLLEMLLYQASLNLNIGKYKTALLILQTPLKAKEAVYRKMMSILTKSDRVLIWLSYLHIVEFRTLPPSLSDVASANPSRIVNKDPAFIKPNWLGKTKASPDKLRTLLDDILTSVNKDGFDAKFSFPFITWLAELELLCGNADAAIQAYSRVLEADPLNTDCWIEIARIHMGKTDFETAKKVLRVDALTKCPLSPKLYFHAATFLQSQGDVDGALDVAEDGAINLFDVDVKSKSCDPNHLYCKLLHQRLPVNYKAPEIKPGLTSENIQKQSQYIWLCYCVLLEVQGYTDSQITDAYETSLSCLHKCEDLQLVWLRYLQYKYDMTRTNDTQESFKSFSDLMHRCLMTMPSKFPLPYSTSKHRLDYSFHNKVLDFYCKCLPHEMVHLTLEKYSSLMPQNIVLADRACQHACNNGDLVLAKGYCVASQYDNPKALCLWKMRLHIAHREGNIRELRKLFRRATKNLPYTLSLWKDFLLFEVANASADGVKYVLDQCHDIELNIQEFGDALFK